MGDIEHGADPLSPDDAHRSVHLSIKAEAPEKSDIKGDVK
jgi:hypothetical protein